MPTAKILARNARATALEMRRGGRAGEGPYKLALFGDSRVGASASIASGQTISSARLAGFLVGELGDCAYYFGGGVSGDNTTNGLATTRGATINPIFGTSPGTRDQSLASLIASQPDVAVIQFGINDAIAGTSAATIGANLCQIIQRIVSANIPVVFTSIEPANDVAAAYVTGASSTGGYGASASAKALAVADANRIVRNFIASLPAGLAAYVNTHDVILDPARILGTNASGDQYGYANSAYMGDGTHMRAAGCYAIAPLVAAAVRRFLPERSWLLNPVPGSGVNFVNAFMLNPTAGVAENFALNIATGTRASAVASITTMPDGTPAQQWIVTPATLSGGFNIEVVQITPPISGASPTFPVAIGDRLMPALRVIVDDGAGGTPPGIAEVVMRDRYFHDDASNIYHDVMVSSYAGDTTLLTSLRNGAIELAPVGLPIAMTKASANILGTAGNQPGIQLRITTTSLTPYRVRVAMPAIRKVN